MICQQAHWDLVPGQGFDWKSGEEEAEGFSISLMLLKWAVTILLQHEFQGRVEKGRGALMTPK